MEENKCYDSNSSPCLDNSDPMCDDEMNYVNEPATKSDSNNLTLAQDSGVHSDHQISSTSVVEGFDSSSYDIQADKNIVSFENVDINADNDANECTGSNSTGEEALIFPSSVTEEGKMSTSSPDTSDSGLVSSTSDTGSKTRIKMLARISLSEAHFRHQQRGEPDLTMDEKIDIAQRLLDESKPKFLARFGNHLEIEDLEYFNDSMGIYEVNFYVNQIRKSKGLNFQKNRVKNRRYEAMKGLICKGEYFSDDEMKFREPFLYQEMVGQYLTDDEIQATIDKSDLRFSTILIKHIDQLDENARFADAKDKEEGQEEEEEESDEEEEEEEEEEMDLEEEKQEVKIETIPDSQKKELKEEFLSIMQQKFLQGDDGAFDYSAVDNNEAYDNLDTLNIEAEEKYFDDEDAESIHSDCT